MNTVDVVAVAPHPDDAELGSAGLLLLCRERGLRTAIIDLTRGEMGTKGDVVTRAAESDAASRALGLETRLNLNLGDGFLEDNERSRSTLASAFRNLRPRLVVTNYKGDRHPDHQAAWRIIQAANLWARLPRAPVEGKIHSIPHICQYFIHDHPEPGFVVDIGPVFERKMEAIRCYRSQFVDFKLPEGYQHIGTANYIRDAETRARYLGSMIGVEFGEGYVKEGPLAVRDPVALFMETK